MRKKHKTGITDIIFYAISGFVFILLALSCFYPFYYVVINSISENSKVLTGQIRWFPVGIHFNNYVDMLKIKGLGRAAFISVARTVLGTCAMIISTTILGYIMSKKEMWHRKFWYRFLTITMYFSAGVIPTYLNIKRLGLLDSFWVYVIPAFVSPYNMILMKTYMESIPEALEEAAIMDGAGYARRFLKIMIPLSRPIIATVAIFTAVGQWNSYMDTILYMTGNDNQTLQSVLYLYLNRANMLANLIRQNPGLATQNLSNAINPTAVKHTVTVVTLIPVMLVYPFFQRYFTSGIMIGAVKG